MLHKKLAATSILFLCSTLSQAQDTRCLFDPFTAPELSLLRAPYQAPLKEPAEGLLLYTSALQSTTTANPAEANPAAVPPQEQFASTSEVAPNLATASEANEAPSANQPPHALPSPAAPDASSSIEAPTSDGAIRKVLIAPRKQPPKSIRPFSTLAIAFKADTLGVGIDLATPLSRSFNLRASANVFDFASPLNIDGVDYDAKLRFRSGQLSLDWFPRHGGFHISPGLLYFKNDLSAPASVPAGKYFELGSQGFINSVDDPLNGTASVTYSRNIAPTLMVGFSNIIPRSGKHLSMPYEIGVAFTGTPRVKVALRGTACTVDGCFDAATNQEVQQSLTNEINKLNNRLKSLPVYPIISVGLAYRF